MPWLLKPLLTAIVISLTGCATRGSLGKDSSLTPAADAYSRNWIVAGPTLVGNLTCGALGVPVYAGMAAFGRCDRSNTGEASSCNWASRNMGQALFVPGIVCGAITGAPFLPLAMLAPERPVHLPK